MEKLIEMGAKSFTKDDAKAIAVFMPGWRYKDVPVSIVTHAISHGYTTDRKILQSAFDALKPDSFVWLPMWKPTCTLEEAVKMGLPDASFETYCKHYGVVNEIKRNALTDAQALMKCYNAMKYGG